MSAPADKHPIPLGLVAAIAVVVLAVTGVLAFALTRDDDAEVEQAGIEGLRTESNLSQNHTDAATNDPIAYPERETRPPLGGNHNQTWQNCQVYDAPVPSEHVVHSLEHGAVWLTYAPGLPAEQVATLASLADGQSHVLVSPYPGQGSMVAATAWGRQLSVGSATDPRVREFLETYVQGPQTPEPGATCSSPLTLTGTVPFGTTDRGRTFTPTTRTEPVSANGALD